MCLILYTQVGPQIDTAVSLQVASSPPLTGLWRLRIGEDLVFVAVEGWRSVPDRRFSLFFRVSHSVPFGAPEWALKPSPLCTSRWLQTPVWQASGGYVAGTVSCWVPSKVGEGSWIAGFSSFFSVESVEGGAP